MTGFVSLVGAGPGDPELLTVKAARRLAEADLVLYDALVSPEALRLAPRAQCFPVGKRPGRHSVKQETIHRLMIRAATRGRQVVRLKCGDPFVLGRGGEEALALAAAGVPFEVIPGLTAAVVAPALSGIPVTHRDVASGFVVVSGHAEPAYRPILETIPPHSLTVVVLMGMASRAALARLLIERGWHPDTPSALCLAAGTSGACTWTGRLDALGAAKLATGRWARPSPRPSPWEGEGARLTALPIDAPGTIVIGRVVAVGARIAAALFPGSPPAAASHARAEEA